MDFSPFTFFFWLYDVTSVANSSTIKIKSPPMIPPPRDNYSPRVTTNNNLASILLDVFQQAFFQNRIISLKNNPYHSIHLKRPERKTSGCRERERGAAANGCQDPVWGEGDVGWDSVNSLKNSQNWITHLTPENFIILWFYKAAEKAQTLQSQCQDQMHGQYWAARPRRWGRQPRALGPAFLESTWQDQLVGTEETGGLPGITGQATFMQRLTR